MPTRKRFVDVLFCAAIFAVLGVQIAYSIFEDRRVTSLSYDDATYEISADGSRTPIISDEARQKIAPPVWAKRLSATISVASGILTILFLIIFFRAAFAPVTFRWFRAGYLLVGLEFFLAFLVLGLSVLLRYGEADSLLSDKTTFGFMSIVFALMLWRRLDLIRYEQSQRKLDALETE